MTAPRVSLAALKRIATTDSIRRIGPLATACINAEHLVMLVETIQAAQERPWLTHDANGRSFMCRGCHYYQQPTYSLYRDGPHNPRCEYAHLDATLSAFTTE